MRLNFDCVRDVLMCIEENTGLRKYCYFVDTGLSPAAQWLDNETTPAEYQQKLSKRYDNDTLIYHVHYCLDAGLAVKSDNGSSYQIFVSDLSPDGHEFLAKIRDESQWGSVKKGLSAILKYSLSAISSVAEGVTSAAISSYFSKKP